MKQVGIVKSLLMSLATLLALSACGPSSGAANNAPPPNKGPAPVIALDNTAPANIDFAMSAGIIQSDPQAPATFAIAPAFYYQKTQIIQFKHGEELQCNGITLPTETGREYITETLPAPGTVMNCTYVSPQGQASFSFTVTEQVKLSSPVKGAIITRSAQTPIIMRLAPGCQSLAFVIGHQGAGGGFFTGTVLAPNGCAAQQNINTLDQSAGPGIVGVQETMTEGAVTNNTGFHSFALSIMTRMEIAVTWQ